MKPVRFVCVLGALLLFASAAEAAGSAWSRSWGAAPLPPSAAMGHLPGSPSFEDQTIRQIVRLSSGGGVLRVRLTNEYGSAPLAVGDAHIALADSNGAIVPGSDRVLSFGGRPDAVIPAGAPLVSDPVVMPVRPLVSLAITVYLPKATGPCTCHATAMQTAYVAVGDHAADLVLPSSSKLQMRAFLSAVEVSGPRPARTIVVLGDSISDGIGSTVDANHRWPDLLADRLVRRAGRAGVALGVSNEGISGNRVLNDGAGVSALARFDRDVLATPGAAYVIVFEGVNDLGISYMPALPEGPMSAYFKRLAGPPVSADDIIAGYKQLIARAHQHGLKIYGATITPYGGATYYSPAGEAQREKINDWIRTGGGFDGVLDFDKVVRDPQQPTQIRTGFHAGDHLHGSDAGYHAIADSIDLSLFR